MRAAASPSPVRRGSGSGTLASISKQRDGRAAATSPSAAPAATRATASIVGSRSMTRPVRAAASPSPARRRYRRCKLGRLSRQQRDGPAAATSPSPAPAVPGLTGILESSRWRGTSTFHAGSCVTITGTAPWLGHRELGILLARCVTFSQQRQSISISGTGSNAGYSLRRLRGQDRGRSQCGRQRHHHRHGHRSGGGPNFGVYLDSSVSQQRHCWNRQCRLGQRFWGPESEARSVGAASPSPARAAKLSHLCSDSRYVTASSGNVTITGTGGNAGRSFNSGVKIDDAVGGRQRHHSRHRRGTGGSASTSKAA